MMAFFGLVLLSWAIVYAADKLSSAIRYHRNEELTDRAK